MDSDGSTMLVGVLIILFFMLTKGFFTGCESALTEVSDAKLRNSSGEHILKDLLKRPTRLLTMFSIHRVLTTIIISFVTVLTFLTPLADVFTKVLTEEYRFIAELISVILLIICITIVIVVLSDRIPRRLISGNTDNFAIKCVPLVKILFWFLTPLTTIVSGITFLFAKLFGISTDTTREVVTEEEILMMVDAGNETGVLEESQCEMINNIFEFGDLQISDVMTHRTDIIALEENVKITNVVSTAINSGKSRIPIYKGDIDNIIGLIYIKDLLCLVGINDTTNFALNDFMRDVLYVPATNKCGDVLRRLIAMKGQLAVAVDEYGGTAGLVTMEDLLEEIVGNMQDEYDDEDEEITKISDGVFIIDGTAAPESILAQLGTKLEDENDDYDTMGGFIIDLLGRVPIDGETPEVIYNDITFTVLLTEEKRVVKIKAQTISQS